MTVFLGCTSTDRVGLCFLWFYGTPKGSTGSGSGFKASVVILGSVRIDFANLSADFIFIFSKHMVKANNLL